MKTSFDLFANLLLSIAYITFGGGRLIQTKGLCVVEKVVPVDISPDSWKVYVLVEGIDIPDKAEGKFLVAEGINTASKDAIEAFYNATDPLSCVFSGDGLTGSRTAREFNGIENSDAFNVFMAWFILLNGCLVLSSTLILILAQKHK